MEEKKEFTYYLTNAAGLYYYVENGVVKTTTTATPLEHAPDGSKDKVINYDRNETYHGVFRSFTIPLRFILNDALILRERLYKFGMEDVVLLIIRQLNYTTGQYDDLYIGEIDFSKYEDSLNFFQVNAIETGLSKYLKAYEGTNHEIGLDKDYIKVKMDGIKIKNKYTYGIVDDAIRGLGANFTVGCAFGQSEGTVKGLETGSSPLRFIGGIPPFADRYIFKNGGAINPVDIVVSGTLIFTLEASLYVSGDVDIKLQTSSSTYFIQPSATLTTGVTYTKNFNFNITLPPGEALYITGFYSNFTSSGPGIIFGESYLYIETLSKFPTTTIRAKKPLAVANELIKKIADSSYSVQSNILKNTTIAITCGDAIRGIEGAKIKTNFKDCFTSFHRNLNIGGIIDGKTFIIESKKSFYNNTLIYDLGEVKDVKFAFYDKIIANKIKVGYANQDYDDVNGRDEFNTTHEYKTTITRISKELDLTAPYRADMYGIEFTRINLEGKTTTDSSSDNDVFMLDVEYDYTDAATGEEYYKLRRPAFTSVTGLIDPNGAFNITLSPKRIFYTHGSEIRGMMWPYTAEKITFQTTDKNPSLKTVQGGVTIQENADILISDLAPNYFIPLTAKFETIVPDNLVELMKTNSAGLFQFTYNDNSYKGWVLSCSQKPATDASQDWTLLLSADNNTTSLIHA